MVRRSFYVLFCLFLSSAAFSQDFKVELSGYAGWTFSSGVPINAIEFDGQIFDRISPVSGYSLGFTFGVFLTENVEVEFAYDRQDSALEGSGRGAKREFAPLKVDNYHGNFVYNWGDDFDVVRPFLFGGLGATSYVTGTVEGREIDNTTRFSMNWGGGIKAYPGRNVGIKLMARWTPTYIKSEPGGVWCSPYWPWGCYVVADTQYSDQFQFAGGITLRF